MKPKPDFLALLQTLAEHQVDFIVIGGVCAVLQGAPISTFDLHLATLIKIKEQVAQDKDRAVLAVLRRTLEQKSRLS